MRTVAIRALWGLLGLATIVGLAVPGVHLIFSAGLSWQDTHTESTRTFTVPGQITSVTVQSYGDDVSMTTGDVRPVQVTARLNYNPQDSGAPPLEQTVSHGHLTLGDPACFYDDYNCHVSFAVTVPPGVSVTVDSDGGNVTVSGTAGANVDSYGGSVTATQIAGPLTVSTGAGNLLVNGLTGPLTADTQGGELDAHGVAAATATIITGGGNANLVYTAAPDDVMVSTDGGTAALVVPGGPYALATSDDQGGTSVRIPTSPSAHRLITVNTGGGPIQITP